MPRHFQKQNSKTFSNFWRYLELLQPLLSSWAPLLIYNFLENFHTKPLLNSLDKFDVKYCKALAEIHLENHSNVLSNDLVVGLALISRSNFQYWNKKKQKIQKQFHHKLRGKFLHCIKTGWFVVSIFFFNHA